MKSSKFKGITLFLASFFAFLIMPLAANAGGYTFSYEAYNCGGTTNNQYKACITKYYNGEEIPKIDPGDTVNPDDFIMLVLKYNHTFTFDEIDDAATALAIYELYDTDFVDVATYTTMGKKSNAAYVATDAANNVFGYDEVNDVDYGEFLSDWSATTNADNGVVATNYTYNGDTAGLMYNPGPLGFVFFKVKTNAPSGQTFTFDFDTRHGDGMNYSAPSDPNASFYIPASAVTPISFKVAGASTSDDRSLKTFTITGDNGLDYPVTPGFVAGTSERSFSVVIPNSVNAITIAGATTDTTAQFIKNSSTTAAIGSDKTVYTTTESTINPGTYTYSFGVHAESGDEDTYEITVYKLSSDATLQALSTSGGNVTLSGFASNKYTYNISTVYNTGNNSKTLVTAKPTHTNAFVTNSSDTLWNKNTSNGNYTNDFNIPGFGSNVNTKTIKVQAEDCLATYSTVPGNTCHTQNYTINVTRANPSTDATLSALTVDGTSVGGFTRTTYSYDEGIKAYAKSSVDIAATANDNKATVVSSTVGNKTLNVGYTTLTVTVQAEDCKVLSGSDPSPGCHTQDYTIKFYRRSNNANLNSLEVTGTDVVMKTAFTDHAYVGPYIIEYPSGTESIHVVATREEPHATINITGIEDGIDYTNLTQQLSIIVTAEDGNTKTYVLRFNKILSTEARLDGLTVSGVSLSPKPFDSDTYSYTGAVDGNIDKVTIGATLKDADKSTFIDGFGPREVSLDYGPNIFYVKVQAEDPDVSTIYNITITRNEKTIKTLDAITIDGVAIDPFDKDTHTYNIDPVPYTTTEVTIGATVTDNDATYAVLNQENGTTVGGVVSLNTGDNKITVRVWAQDGSSGDYILNIPRTKNNDATISSVKFFGETANCNSETRKCTITLDNTKANLAPTDVVITTNDTEATISKPTNTIALVTNTPSNPRTNAYLFSVTAENGTTTLEYEVTITREPNSDNTMKEVSVKTNNGQTFRCLTFTDYACTISVPSTTTSYILSGTANATTSNVSGGGTFTMTGASDSSQLRTLVVTAEDGLSQTYQIRIERGKSTNANLSTITIDGTQIANFDGVNKQNYTVIVPGTTETIELGAVVEDTGKAVIENESSILGRKDLVYGDNDYSIKVIAEAGGSAVKTYTVKVIRSNNVDSSLSMITIGGADLDGFTSTTLEYDGDSEYYQSLGISNPLVVPYTQTTVTIEGIPTDTIHGTVKYNNGTNNTITLATGLNTITVTGVAHDTSKTTDYVLKIYRSLNTTNAISKLVIAGVEATWNGDSNKYVVTVPNSVESVGPLNVDVTLPATALPGDPKATVVIPTKTLVTDDATYGNVNNYQITVTSESGDARTYNVEITREKSDVNTLKALTVTNGAFSPSFIASANYTDEETGAVNTYKVIVPASTTQFTVGYVKDDVKSNVTIDTGALVTMDASTKQVVITVTAENGDENTYTLNVERTESVVNTLSSLTINAGDIVYPLNEAFSPDRTEYTVTIPGTIDKINVSATVTDNRAEIVSGTGEHDVHLGEQTIVVRVRSEAGATPLPYSIKVTVLPKTIATLDGLEVSIPKTDGTSTPLALSPDFDASTLNYTLTDQPYSVSKINIKANVSDSDATLKINGVTVTSGVISIQTLEVGTNIIPVTVTAQDGTTVGNYKITIKRAGNNDATLSNLNISGGTLSPAFNPSVEDYTVTLSATSTSLDPNSVTATPNDSNARAVKGGEVTITGNPDDDVFTIDVTAQDGVTTKQYRVKVVRRLSSDATLKEVELTGATLEGTFLSSNHNYVINVPSTSTSFTINGIPTSDRAKRVEGNDTYNIDEITGPITLKVIAEDDTEGTYTFTVYTASSHDASLSGLQVVGYTLNPTFATTTLTYDIGEVNLGTSSLNVVATPTNPDALVYYYIGAQTPSTSNIVTLPQAIGEYTITIKVVPATRLDSEAKYYSVNYQMVKSDNNYLSLLNTPSGTLTPAFARTTTTYRMSVPYDTNSVSFQVKAEDNSASVSIDGTNYYFTDTETKTFTVDNLSVGANAKTIYVKAANGDIKEYSITITRNNRVASDDVYLSGLSVDSFTYLEENYHPTLSPAFDREVEAYSIGAIPFGQDTLIVRATKNISSQTITYELNGSPARVTVNEDGSATINIKDKIGSNVIGITVTAEDGTSTKPYQITYTRTPSSNVYLESIVDSLSKITGFNKNTVEYNINVDTTVSTLRMTLTTEDKTSTISIGNDSRTHQWVYTTPTLSGGANTVTIIVTAENGDTKTYTVTINKEGAAELITSRAFGHKIEDGMIKSAILGESLLDLKNQLDNDNSKLQIWDAKETNELTNLTAKVATGQIVKLIDLTTGRELDRKVIVVLGDTDGNGNITLFDSVKIVNHYLDKTPLEGAYLEAADVDKNKKITLFDSVKIVNHYLDKTYIDYSV